MKISSKLVWILLIVDFIWLKSSFGKLTQGSFIQNIGPVLKNFASKNPYPPVKSFLETVAIPNSNLFGSLTMWGEVLTVVALSLGLLAILFKSQNKFTNLSLALGLLGAAFLNLIFWLSAGWTSVSTDSLNLLMFGVEVVGLTYFFKEAR